MVPLDPCQRQPRTCQSTTHVSVYLKLISSGMDQYQLQKGYNRIITSFLNRLAATSNGLVSTSTALRFSIG